MPMVRPSCTRMADPKSCLATTCIDPAGKLSLAATV